MRDGWGGGGVCPPSTSRTPLDDRPVLEGVGACPTSAEPLTPQQDISQTHSASSAPTTAAPPTSYSPPRSVSTPAPG